MVLRASSIRLCTVVLSTALALFSSPSSAQYLYLDSNGDGQSSQADVLNDPPASTAVRVYLETTKNGDGSSAFCSTGPESLDVLSYEFIVHASNGTVSYDSYASSMSSMGVSFGQHSDDHDFYVGFGGMSSHPPGLYLLGTLTLHVLGGSPTLSPATSTPVHLGGATSFGTHCLGPEQDNTWKLGVNWHSISGCGPPAGNAQPIAATPPEANVRTGEAVYLVSEFYDAESDSLALDVTGLPPGLQPVAGRQFEGRKQVRVYGQLRGAQGESAYDVIWSATDGVSSQVVHTRISTGQPTMPAEELEKRVLDTITTRYSHGMPPQRARALGPAALPILSRLLRNEGYKGDWIKVVQAMGNIGDTAYFDTLHAFIWNRFHGEIDRQTFYAIEIAQANLYPVATLSQRALDYLLASANSSFWLSTPWRVQGLPLESVTTSLVGHTLSALSLTDSDRVDAILQALPTSGGQPLDNVHNQGLRDNHSTVRRRGFITLWEENWRVSQ